MLGLGFQFLIGRLKTVKVSCKRAYRSWFQFLIGRLKTKKIRKIGPLHIRVSIPYR